MKRSYKNSKSIALVGAEVLLSVFATHAATLQGEALTTVIIGAIAVAFLWFALD